jgi:ABC-type dipeptide/oligopeptide/nickel transport system permease component
MEGGELRRWVLRRLVESAVTFALALTIVFFLMRATPGDPLARVAEGRTLAPAEVAALRSRYGLDQPLPAQLLEA